MSYASTAQPEIFVSYRSSLAAESMALSAGDAGKQLYKFMQEDVLRYTIYVDLMFLNDFVFIDSIHQIHDYFLYHPDMIEPVLSICKQSVEMLGKDVQLILAYEVDPEINHDSLVLYVRQAYYPQDLFHNIVRIIQANEHLLAHRSGWITVTTDFNPPHR